MAKRTSGFDVVVAAARALPDVAPGGAWGARSLKAGGTLIACEAIHKSAEPASIVVKVSFDQRAELIEAEPDVYYVTDHYVNFPCVLVRLPRIHRDALRDLLAMAWQTANTKRAGRKRSRA